jgi:hypothetical protein
MTAFRKAGWTLFSEGRVIRRGELVDLLTPFVLPSSPGDELSVDTLGRICQNLRCNS